MGGSKDSLTKQLEGLGVQTSPSDIRKEAADWVAQEERAWVSFAQQTLRDSPSSAEGEMKKTRDGPLLPSPYSTGNGNRGSIALPPMALGALENVRHLGTPKLPSLDSTLGGSRMLQPLQPGLAAVDEHPGALMDIIDAEKGQPTRSPMRSAPNDFRPNRLIKGTTRTSRVTRRSGMVNSTMHRDLVLTNKDKVIQIH